MYPEPGNLLGISNDSDKAVGRRWERTGLKTAAVILGSLIHAEAKCIQVQSPGT